MSVSPGAAVLEPTPDSASVISGGAPQQRFWQRHATVLLAVFLALLTLALYANSIHAGFVSYDDPGYVTNNSQVQRGLTGPGITWAFITTTEANWHPLTWLSHMTDVQVFGMRPAGHHLTNVLLHTLNVVLFFLLLHSATRAHLRSAAAAALFAVHPLNVEGVAWVAERKQVLSLFFMLLALVAYVWYAQRPGLGRYALVAAMFVCALMSKVMIITLPFALLL